uniref:Uncharacterized protein n=1 Tax=Cyprinus carpio carpio TaxID=630221 RepID=A0A8C1AYY5_CYPCA
MEVKVVPSLCVDILTRRETRLAQHVRVTRMLHITRKGIPHDGMPGALILSVKFLKEKKEKCSNATCILVHIHSQKSTLQCLTLHLVTHDCIMDHNR